MVNIRKLTVFRVVVERLEEVEPLHGGLRFSEDLCLQLLICQLWWAVELHVAVAFVVVNHFQSYIKKI